LRLSRLPGGGRRARRARRVGALSAQQSRVLLGCWVAGFRAIWITRRVQISHAFPVSWPGLRQGPAALCHFRDKCCFQVIYFVSNISFVPSIETRSATGGETVRLRAAVKNACVRAAGPPLSRSAQRIRPRKGATGMEKTMSLKVAAALAVTIGAGIVMSSPAQARGELVGMQSSEYSPGTI